MLAMRWADLDLAAGIWWKPAERDQAERGPRRAAVGAGAATAEPDLIASGNGGEYVFPGGDDRARA